jgi:hypothetical protein
VLGGTTAASCSEGREGTKGATANQYELGLANIPPAHGFVYTDVAVGARTRTGANGERTAGSDQGGNEASLSPRVCQYSAGGLWFLK